MNSFSNPNDFDSICNEFEAVWKSGQSPHVEEFLNRAAESRRAKLLTELLQIELWWRREEALTAEEYKYRFPNCVAEVDAAFLAFNSKSQDAAKGSTGEWGTLTLPQDQDNQRFFHEATLPAERGTDATGSIPNNRIRYFGEYELLDEIARGGMGVVFKAKQINLNRIVALKMILSGNLAGEEEVQRFHTEAEAAANLDHPGIVPIYEIGEHDGQHYFSMGFVDGDSLQDKLRDGPLPPREAAELCRKIAESVAYAHEKGVIHRDLKPPNVLLDPSGEPKVTDFGLAKQVESDSDLTRSGAVMGTPSYMPPEQASGKTDEVGPRADVYSLGAILYCMLVGRPPFQAANVLDTLMQVIESEPVAPRSLDNKIPLDLETICLKCLQKNPASRYASAQELVDELERFGRHEPIKARRIGHAARTLRWCQRNPVVTGFLALTTVMLLVVAGSLWSEAKQRKLAELQTATLKRNNYNLQLSRAWQLTRESPKDASAILGNVNACPWNMLDFSWRMLDKINSGGKVLEFQQPAKAQVMEFSGDGSRLHVVAGDHLTRVDLVTGQVDRTELCEISTRVEPKVQLLTLTPRGDHALVRRRPDPNYVRRFPDVALCKWSDNYDHWPLLNWYREDREGRFDDYTPDPQYTVVDASFSPDGRLFVTAFSQEVRLWSFKDGSNPTFKELSRVEFAGANRAATKSVQFLPTGSGVLVVDKSAMHTLINIDNKTKKLSLAEPLTIAGDLLGVSSDSERLLLRDENGQIKVADLDETKTSEFASDSDDVLLAGFSSDPTIVTIVRRNGQVQNWDLGTETITNTTQCKDWPDVIGCCALSPQATSLSVEGPGGEVSIWEIGVSEVKTTLTLSSSAVVGFTSDSTSLVTSGTSGSIQFWDLPRIQIEHEKPNKPWATCDLPTGFPIQFAFSADGNKGLAVSAHGQAFSIEDLQTTPTISPVKNARLNRRPNSLAFSPSGDSAGVSFDNGSWNTWDLAASAGLVEPKAWLGAAKASTTDFIEPESYALTEQQRQFAKLVGADSSFGLARISPDASVVACTKRDNTVALYDTETGVERIRLAGHRDEIFFLAYTYDGRTIVTASKDSTVRFWDPITGEERLLVTAQSLRSFSESGAVAKNLNDGKSVSENESISSIAFSPDGQYLAIGYRDGLVQLWPARPPAFRGRIIEPGTKAWSVAFSLDNQTIVSSEYGKHGAKIIHRDIVTASIEREITCKTSHTPLLSAHARVGYYFTSEDTLVFWDTSSDQVTQRRWRKEVPRENLRFSVDGSAMLLHTGSLSSCRVFDAYGNELPMVPGIANEGPEYDRQVYQFAVASNGSQVAFTGGQSNSTSLWRDGFWLWNAGDLGGAKSIQIKGLEHAGWFPVAFVNRETWLAFAHETGRIKFVDLAKRELVAGEIALGRRYSAFQHGGRPVSFSMDGTKMACFNDERQLLMVWDIPTISLDHAFDAGSIPGHKSGLVSKLGVALSPDGSHVALRRLDSDLNATELVVYALAETRSNARRISYLRGQEVEKPKIELVSRDNPFVHRLMLARDGRHLLTRSTSNPKELLWDLSSRNHPVPIESTGSAKAFSLSGTKFITTESIDEGSSETFAIAWDTATGKEIGRLRTNELAVPLGPLGQLSRVNVAISDNGKFAVSGIGNWRDDAASYSVDLWDVQSGKILKRLMTSGKVSAISFVSGHESVLVAEHGTIRKFDIGSGEQTQIWKGRDFRAVSKDDPLIAMTVRDSYRDLEIVNANTGRMIGRTTLKNVVFAPMFGTETPGGIEFTSKGLRHIYTGSFDHEELFDLNSSKSIAHLANQKYPQMTLDGNRILSLSKHDDTVTFPAPLNRIKDPQSLADQNYSRRYSRVVISDADSGSYLGELIPFFNREWIVVDSAGRFDSSSQSVLENVGWWNGTTVLALSDLVGDYAEPGLLPKLMGFDKDPVRDVKRPTPDKLESLRKSAEERKAAAYKKSIIVPEGHENLLSMIDLERDWTKGKWKQDNGLLEGVEGNSAIEFPYSPPPEYRMTAVVEPLDNPFSILLGQRCGGKRFLVMLSYNRRNALQKFDGNNHGLVHGQWLTKNKVSTIEVTVRENSVLVTVDGEERITWEGDPALFSANHRTPNDEALMLHTHSCRYRIHRLSIEALSGEGKVLEQ